MRHGRLAEAATALPFHYTYDHFREHLKRWLYQSGRPETVKEYLREFYPDKAELDWKHVRFYEALAYMEALLKQHENSMADYWHRGPSVEQSELSGYLVLAVWSLMANASDELLYKYPAKDQVKELAHGFWMGALTNQGNPAHQISPEMATSGPPRQYNEKEFQADLYPWLERPTNVEALKQYFISKYGMNGESLWKLRRLIAALNVLKNQGIHFPEFARFELPLILGVWRYLSNSTHEMLNAPDVETIRYLALSERKKWNEHHQEG